MTYKSISVREAMERINDEWFLPSIQRPYVWGERYKKEEFIYKLFDSLMRKWPISSFLVWPTKKPIPFRNFLNDFESNGISKIREEGTWGSKKELVYDGQQRLQSLHSCLKYTFQGQVLCYNLLFDSSTGYENEKITGTSGSFQFKESKKKIPPTFLRMTELFKCNRDDESEFEEKILKRLKGLTPEEQKIVKKNLKRLWNVFVEYDRKLVSYYELEKDLKEDEVLEIFIRINTAGQPLENADILFSRIKSVEYDFEEKIWMASREIKNRTAGFSFGPNDILQTIFLIKKGAVRIDHDRVYDSELEDFGKIWKGLEKPMYSFFSDFLYGEFKINKASIIPKKLPLLPLIAYFYYVKKNHKLDYKKYSEETVVNIKKFFILSQLNDWYYQRFMDNFHRIIKDETSVDVDNPSFPFEKLKKFVRSNKKYTGFDIDFMEDYTWFSLKILTPKRLFSWIPSGKGRFNPEIDHIFPENPTHEIKYRNRYGDWVYDLWNLQPVKGDINNLKLAEPPSDFFKKHKRYLKEYDHLPTLDINNSIWLDENASKFIKTRKKLMRDFMRDEYGL